MRKPPTSSSTPCDPKTSRRSSAHFQKSQHALGLLMAKSSRDNATLQGTYEKFAAVIVCCKAHHVNVGQGCGGPVDIKMH